MSLERQIEIKLFLSTPLLNLIQLTKKSITGEFKGDFKNLPDKTSELNTV